MATPNLTALLAQRNARLRAWRALGVPVTGGWLYWAGGGFTFLAGCAVCGAIIQPRVLDIAPAQGVSSSSSIHSRGASGSASPGERPSLFMARLFSRRINRWWL